MYKDIVCKGTDDFGDYVLTKQSDGKQAGRGYYQAEQEYCENASSDKPECFVKE
ncbi:MAG: hypothetical protein UIH99_02025 [Alphaproteobacteria bacterium]|nr:hypothetical protein [Alphaproteobacteria bacterium]